MFQGSIVGKYYIDFLINNKVVVELKVRNKMYEKDCSQILDYMKSQKIPTGLLILLTSEGVKIKRFVNDPRESE